ncbi:hypothetical protein OSTOST_10231, partial [Ostertagia ostertagi]
MGNNQPGGINKRDRPGDYTGVSTPGRHRTFSGNPQSISNPEDGCPVQVKIAKSDDDMEGGMAPTVQFRESNEYPVVFKWHCSATSQRAHGLHLWVVGWMATKNTSRQVIMSTNLWWTTNGWWMTISRRRTTILEGRTMLMSIDQDDFESIPKFRIYFVYSMRGLYSHAFMQKLC